ncbi:hypothetical protein KGA66_24450 [Actinocrinis puniceicyclus]|uniref:Amidase domain-containing protein n=1 Tax=Actinocrinis puniceicyclus TaxID=977794 RepID=A0A8J8BEB9_9ACTN|nr:hypothetical protein [Actinocrinis puniceicyclus]MBS2966218.1 hypothetical protein [Actinocrinis puniceicyclus]
MPATALVAGLALAGSTLSAAPAFAQATRQTATRTAALSASQFDGNTLTRDLEVNFADNHWSWTAWNDSTPVAFGSGQPDYQCAEFVARALAAAGLVPGLSPDAPQDDYFHYHAPNGQVYDLLLITPLPQYKTIYDFLMDSGLATDVGDDEAAAQPGDMVVTYLGYDGEASHMGLVATAPTATAEATVDAHNNARYRFGYHYYAPSHLVKLVPNAFVTVWAWAAEQWLSHGTSETVNQHATVNDRMARATDPTGPQV